MEKVKDSFKAVGTTGGKIALAVGGGAGAIGSVYTSFSGTNEFQKQPDNYPTYTPKTLGFRTKIDEKNPGHSDVINIVSHLTAIWKYIKSNHKDEINTLFDLTIETKNQNSPVIVPNKRNILVKELFSDIKESEVEKS